LEVNSFNKPLKEESIMTLTTTQIARRNAIIKDIIQKRPTENGCTYTAESYFDYERNYQRTRMVPSKKLFGYDPAELSTLGFRKTGYDLTYTLRSLFDKGVRQKYNRFEERIGEPLRQFVYNTGVPGLYSVSTRSNDVGFIYAVDLKEAIRIADVSYGFIIAGKSDRWGDPLKLSVQFKKHGKVEDLHMSNQDDVKSILRQIEYAKKEVGKINQNIERFEAELIAIQMSELSQLSASFEDDSA
jgi:hypothetical protein